MHGLYTETKTGVKLPMPCGYTARAETGIGALIVVAGGLLIARSTPETRQAAEYSASLPEHSLCCSRQSSLACAGWRIIPAGELTLPALEILGVAVIIIGGYLVWKREEMSNPPGFRFFSLVLQNLKNRPYRNIATVFSFAVIAATLFSSQYLIHGAEQSLDSGMSRMGADILVVPEEYAGAGQTVLLIGQPNSFFFNNSGFEKITRIPGVVKASPQIYIATLFASCCAAPVQMIAIDQENDFTVSPWLKANPDVKMGKDDMIIGSAIIQNTGNDLMFYGHTFHVVGILERTGTGIDNSVFVRFEDAYVMADESDVKAVKKLTIPPGMVSAVLVKVDPGASAAGSCPQDPGQGRRDKDHNS